jgi:hypothetical protein
MKNKYEFQIKYYKDLIEKNFIEYLRYLNNNKLPYDLDILHKEIKECIEAIEKYLKKCFTE